MVKTSATVFDVFIKELRQLCRKHGVQLSVSDYDSLQVWPLKDGDEEIHSAGIENKIESE
jgi:hypothetical protein